VGESDEFLTNFNTLTWTGWRRRKKNGGTGANGGGAHKPDRSWTLVTWRHMQCTGTQCVWLIFHYILYLLLRPAVKMMGIWTHISESRNRWTFLWRLSKAKERGKSWMIWMERTNVWRYCSIAKSWLEVCEPPPSHHGFSFLQFPAQLIHLSKRTSCSMAVCAKYGELLFFTEEENVLHLCRWGGKGMWPPILVKRGKCYFFFMGK
jgi:hypothetical protein